MNLIDTLKEITLSQQKAYCRWCDKPLSIPKEQEHPLGSYCSPECELEDARNINLR